MVSVGGRGGDRGTCDSDSGELGVGVGDGERGEGGEGGKAYCGGESDWGKLGSGSFSLRSSSMHLLHLTILSGGGTSGEGIWGWEGWGCWVRQCPWRWQRWQRAAQHVVLLVE